MTSFINNIKKGIKIQNLFNFNFKLLNLILEY